MAEMTHLATTRYFLRHGVWNVACGRGTTMTLKASRLAHRVSCKLCTQTDAFKRAPVAGVRDLPGNE